MNNRYVRVSLSKLALASLLALTAFGAHAISYQFVTAVPGLDVEPGVIAAPAFSLSATALDFGDVIFPGTKDLSLVVTNSGNVPLSTPVISAAGSGFTAKHNCAETLAVGDSCQVTSTFAPVAPQSYSGTVSVSYAGLTAVNTVTQVGTGASPATFATWDPLQKGSVVLSNDNLTQANGGGGWSIARTTLGKSAGKWYWEIHVDSFGNDTRISIGAALGTSNLNSTHSPGYWRKFWGESDSVFTGASVAPYGTSYTAGDTIGVLLDATSHTLRFYKNCVDQGPTNYELPPGTYYPFVTSASSTANPTITTANFGATAFRCPVPSGYNAGMF